MRLFCLCHSSQKRLFTASCRGTVLLLLSPENSGKLENSLACLSISPVQLAAMPSALVSWHLVYKSTSCLHKHPSLSSSRSLSRFFLPYLLLRTYLVAGKCLSRFHSSSDPPFFLSLPTWRRVLSRVLRRNVSSPRLFSGFVFFFFSKILKRATFPSLLGCVFLSSVSSRRLPPPTSAHSQIPSSTVSDSSQEDGERGGLVVADVSLGSYALASPAASSFLSRDRKQRASPEDKQGRLHGKSTGTAGRGGDGGEGPMQEPFGRGRGDTTGGGRVAGSPSASSAPQGKQTAAANSQLALRPGQAHLRASGGGRGGGGGGPLPPPYGQREGFIPRTEEDFGGGGAFPEIPVAQYPLGLGKKKTVRQQTRSLLVLLHLVSLSTSCLDRPKEIYRMTSERHFLFL